MDDTSFQIVLGVGAFASVLLFAKLLGEGQEDAHFQHRLSRVRGESHRPHKVVAMQPAGSIRKNTYDSAIPMLDKFIKAFLPRPEKLREKLARTGRSIRLSEYLLSSLLVAAIASWLAGIFFDMSVAGLAMLGVFFGIALPNFVIGRMGERRTNAFLKVFPEAIDAICRGLRSGLPIAVAIASVGREMPDPVGVEFSRVADSVHMGRSVEEGMWEVERRLDIPEFRFLIIAMSIQRETGGNLAETMKNLADLLRRRRQMKMKIRAMSSEARASAMIIGSLPFVLFTLLMFVNSAYVMILINDPRGNTLGGIALGWLSIGFFVMSRMVKFEI